MISFWFHIKQPRQFHWAVAAQSGKPITRGGGQVIKVQTATIITRHGGRQLLDSTRCKVHFCVASTSCIRNKRLGRSGCIEPSCSPGWTGHCRRNSARLWSQSSIKQEKPKLFATLFFSFYFPRLDKIQMFSSRKQCRDVGNHFLTLLRNLEQSSFPHVFNADFWKATAFKDYRR